LRVLLLWRLLVYHHKANQELLVWNMDVPNPKPHAEVGNADDAVLCAVEPLMISSLVLLWKTVSSVFSWRISALSFSVCQLYRRPPRLHHLRRLHRPHHHCRSQRHPFWSVSFLRFWFFSMMSSFWYSSFFDSFS